MLWTPQIDINLNFTICKIFNQFCLKNRCSCNACCRRRTCPSCFWPSTELCERWIRSALTSGRESCCCSNFFPCQLVTFSICWHTSKNGHCLQWQVSSVRITLKSILIQFVNLCELIISILSLYGICVHYEENCKFW